MDYQMLGMILGPVFILVGYLHVRLTTTENNIKMTVSEDDVRKILDSKLELMSLQIRLLGSRIDRLEESLDRISAKIDSLILR